MKYNIKEYAKVIDRVIMAHNSGGLKEVSNIEPLLRQYDKRKQFIKGLFNGEYILEKEISIDKSAEILEKEIRHFRSRAIFENVYGNGIEIYPFLVKVTIEEIVSNKIEEEIRIGKNITIPKGMKFTRALKFFFPEGEKEMLDKMQTDYSKIMNQKTLKGTLCLSIHPMDFFTMSHNTFNWRSCMATDGEYRAGILSYLNDDTTIVAYLKSSDDDNSSYIGELDTKWNSKKWRQLFYLNKNAIVSSKGYPYHSNDLTTLVFEWIESLMPSEKFSEMSAWVSDKNKIVYKEDWDSSAYIDLDQERNKAMIKQNLLLENVAKADIPPIEIGGSAECVVCHCSRVSSGDSYACCECSNGARCECCGELVFNGDVFLLEGEELCEWCYDEYALTCESCGDTYHQDSDFICYDENVEEYRCEDCLDS